MIRIFVISLLFVLFTDISCVHAHTLGVDKADLTEMADGSYHIVSHVPQNLAYLITTPVLPERCFFNGNPRGVLGFYEVRLIFTCKTPLTARDEIVLPWNREGVMLTVAWQDAEAITRFTRREGTSIRIDLGEYLARSGSVWDGAERYTILGIEHILVGLDHLLFVLALLFVVHRGWKLVQTITAFTVAHSITLGLATLGYIHVPSAPVEAAIALSIVFLCAEIIHAKQGHEPGSHIPTRGLSPSLSGYYTVSVALVH